MEFGGSAALATRPDAAQIRGARAMLGWSMADLASAANVSVSTVKRIEVEAYGVVADATWAIVQRALEAAGVTFLREDRDGIGLRLRRI